MRRWSKLQKQLYQIIDPAIGFQIQCRVYAMDSLCGSTGIPRYWITLGKEIIWDYPKHFVSKGFLDRHLPYKWPYATDVSGISDLIRNYIDTPREQLLIKTFQEDVWELVDILRAADRRLGNRQWDLLEQRTQTEAARKILARRREVKRQ